MTKKKSDGKTELDRIEALLSQASPGPWESWIEGRDQNSGSDVILTPGNDIELTGATRADYDFIASARQDVPWLLGVVRALMNVLEERGIAYQAALDATLNSDDESR